MLWKEAKKFFRFLKFLPKIGQSAQNRGPSKDPLKTNQILYLSVLYIYKISKIKILSNLSKKK
jgi:hypothetical protein